MSINQFLRHIWLLMISVGGSGCGGYSMRKLFRLVKWKSPKTSISVNLSLLGGATWGNFNWKSAKLTFNHQIVTNFHKMSFQSISFSLSVSLSRSLAHFLSFIFILLSNIFGFGKQKLKYEIQNSFIWCDNLKRG